MTDPPARLTVALSASYRLERELGVGGMATVYLAHDLKHDRRVAIKVLKPDLAAVLGAERFITEIKTTAALQHPHILPLFDSGSADGFLFYVMPFVDGETLRARLDRERQLGIDDALRIAREVADALDYAHRHGVIHRDIKPENILLHDGRATVADFGIALAVSAAAGGRMTETGLSLGTPHYMSPEQATAEREITGRSDVYSLGCVLYEMLTGNPPHTGATAQQIIMKIVTEEPAPVLKLRKSVPPHVADAIAQAVEKLPADRFGTAKEFAEALAGTGAGAVRRRTGSDGGAGAAGVPKRRRAVLLALALPVLAIAGATGWALRGAPRVTAPGPVVRFTIAPEGDGLIRDPAGSSIAVAPDGRRLVYAGRDSLGVAQLYVYELDAGTTRALSGTQNANAPFFSPDGEHIGFSQEGQLRRLALAGGAVVTIAPQGNNGATWGADDWIYLHSTNRPVLRRVPARGGAVEQVSRGDTKGTDGFRWLDALPDGRGILLTLVREGRPELAAVSLPDGTLHRFGESGMSPRWLEGGVITYLQPDGALMLARLDVTRWRLASRPVPVTGNVSFGPAFPGKFGIGRNGVLAFLPGGVSNNFDLNLVSDGRTEVLLGSVFVMAPRFSPDGRRLVYEVIDLAVSNSRGDLWLHDLATRTNTRLTIDSSSHSAAWYPESRHIAYVSGRYLLRLPIDRSAPPDTLHTLEREVDNLQLDPSGQFAYMIPAYAGPGTMPILRVPLGGNAAAQPVSDATGSRNSLALSPDGNWLAYESNESGTWQLYVRRLADGGGIWAVPVRGGSYARWAADGRALHFHDGERLLTVSFTAGPEPIFGDPRPLVTAPLPVTLRWGTAQWDLSPDGQRIVAVVPRDLQSDARSMVLMLNWLERLRAELR